LGILLYAFSLEDTILKFIGGSLIQVGLSLLIINIILSKIGQDIFRQQVREDFREEIIAIMKRYPYKVENVESKKLMKYSTDRNNKYNLNLFEMTNVNIIALEDNVHYRFRRISSNVTEKLNFNVFLNDILLNNNKDIHDCGDGLYQIIKKLKKDQKYNIKILLRHNNIMSDLNNKEIKEDWFNQEFIELTDHSKTEIVFPFSLKNYQFFIRRSDACGRISYLKPDIKNNKILIEQENLHDGDNIDILYRKKDNKINTINERSSIL
jgi:hypothetical protein